MTKNEIFSINLPIENMENYQISVLDQTGQRIGFGSCSEITITAKNREQIKSLISSLEKTLKQIGDSGFFANCGMKD